MKVHRRHDLLLPGNLKTCKTNIIYGVDVSGSMSDEDLAEGYAIVNRLFAHATVTQVQFDTEIKHICKNATKLKSTYDVYGRGGTDFNKIIEFADNMRADGLIIYTDGMADNPIPPKRAKVLWLMSSKKYNPPRGCNFGYVAHLNRYDN